MKHLLTKIIALLLLLTGSISYGEGIGPGLSVPALWGVNHEDVGGTLKVNLYAYKKGAEQISFNFKKLNDPGGATGTWTMRMYSPSGLLLAQQTMTNSTVKDAIRMGTPNSTETGIFSLVIEVTSLDIQYSADVNVKTNGTASGVSIPGRVYTYDVGVYSATMPTFSVYSVNEQGYKYTSTFYGLYPVRIMFRINPYGNVLKGTCTSAYKSYSSGSSTITPDPRYEPGNNCGGGSKIFFSPIAEDVPLNAVRWDLTTNTTVTEWLNPAIAAENVTGLTFSPTEGSAGNFTFNVVNYIGNATLKIDVNNNGVYTDAVDRSIPTGVTMGSNSVAFDGKDGAGNALPCGTTMKAQLLLDKPGEIHFVLWDAEGLGGIKITRTTGVSSPSSLINWDDSHVYPAGKTSTTPVLVGTNVNSSFNTTTHGWTTANTGWGNDAGIDNWAFLPGLTNQEITFVAPCPVPDLTPTTEIDELNFAEGAARDFVVNVFEILNIPTTGQIRFRINKISGFTITYPTTSGVSNVFGGTTNQNSNWTFTENASFITVTANAGVNIAANGQAILGFRVARNPNVASGTTQNITATIIGLSGGETRIDNNNVVTSISAN